MHTIHLPCVAVSLVLITSVACSDDGGLEDAQSGSESAEEDADSDESGDGDGDESGDGDGDESGDGDGDESGDGDGDAGTTGEDPLEFTLEPSAIKRFAFSWPAQPGADYYRLLEQANPEQEFVPLGGEVMGTAVSHVVPLFARAHASYILQACDEMGCADAGGVDVTGTLTEAIGYIKAPNPDISDMFGSSLALSGDGHILAVGSYKEASDSTGISAQAPFDNDAPDSGAVYIYVRDAQGEWAQEAFIKASNANVDDKFGIALAFSDDGSTLAVTASEERSTATGVGGDMSDNFAPGAGAAYVFGRSPQGVWSEQAYLKASNTDAEDYFGSSMALSGDGRTLVVGSSAESSDGVGINGAQDNELRPGSGAVYVFNADAQGTWSAGAYIKAAHPDIEDRFGASVALDTTGSTLAVGAVFDDGGDAGVNGDESSSDMWNSGAVYVFVREGLGPWTQQAYVKASNLDESDFFGHAVALSGDGNMLGVGTPQEQSNAQGIDGDASNNEAPKAGAVYLFERDEQSQWSQRHYLKGSNTMEGDYFGMSLSFSSDGRTLAVGAERESSKDAGVEASQEWGGPGSGMSHSGAVYMFALDEDEGSWEQTAFVRASNPEGSAKFGADVALSADAQTLAVGARDESNFAQGVGGMVFGEAEDSGAVYVY